jgi:hypothetical protein
MSLLPEQNDLPPPWPRPTHCPEADHAESILLLFGLISGNFDFSLGGEEGRIRALKITKRHMKPHPRALAGFTGTIGPLAGTPEAARSSDLSAIRVTAFATTRAPALGIQPAEKAIGGG